MSELQTWSAFGGGMLLVLAGASRRSFPGLCIAAAGAPLLYRGLTGRWPPLVESTSDRSSASALAGDKGIHVREAIRLEAPIGDVYAWWRRLENLPRFMAHLDSVQELDATRSHWVTKGPVGLRVEWDAEVINDVPCRVLAWRSTPGSDIVTAGSVTFERVRDGRSTQVVVHLQYAPPAGRAGALFASLFGRAPGQSIREDLRRFKQFIEAGEAATAGTEDRAEAR